MINDVRDAFKANLKNLEWMDNETRDAAESKADAITDMIGEFLCHLITKE
jgi:endothelin-converting enzyme